MSSHAHAQRIERTRRLPALTIALAGLLLGLGGHASGAVLSDDNDEPIYIDADSAEYDDRVGVAIYRGSVEMVQGSVDLMADLVTVELDEARQVVRVTAEGDRARYRQQIGDDTELVTALARTIVYLVQEEHVELIGDAHLSQRQNEFSGRIIRYDIRAGRVEADEDVRMILQPGTRRP